MQTYVVLTHEEFTELHKTVINLIQRVEELEKKADKEKEFSLKENNESGKTPHESLFGHNKFRARDISAEQTSKEHEDRHTLW